ncbi:hypothetical protein, partial [Staphylococcus aureus]|uniref:hypothetical protein n=1 Tax=Staphylococcus aureus TaxID=1280 RepID=UPI00065BF0CB
FRDYYDKYTGPFVAKTGAEGIKDLLEEIDLDEELKLLRDELESATGHRLSRAIKSLEVVASFRNSCNKPSWIILDVLLIIPSE